jgi:hypothetical protein
MADASKGCEVRFFCILLLALVGTAASARACTDGSAMRHYFFDHQPAAREGRDVLLVRIVGIDGNVVRARLEARFAKALGIDVVTIELPEYPLGTNCIGYGMTSGLAFVVVDRLIRQEPGAARIVAVALREPYDTRPRRSRAELDSYITDPTMREAAVLEGDVQ